MGIKFNIFVIQIGNSIQNYGLINIEKSIQSNCNLAQHYQLLKLQEVKNIITGK